VVDTAQLELALQLAGESEQMQLKLMLVSIVCATKHRIWNPYFFSKTLSSYLNRYITKTAFCGQKLSFILSQPFKRETQVEIFWVVTLRNVVIGYQCFRSPCCLYLQGETTLHEDAKSTVFS
jgi:hypothetical protein